MGVGGGEEWEEHVRSREEWEAYRVEEGGVGERGPSGCGRFAELIVRGRSMGSGGGMGVGSVRYVSVGVEACYKTRGGRRRKKWRQGDCWVMEWGRVSL